MTYRLAKLLVFLLIAIAVPGGALAAGKDPNPYREGVNALNRGDYEEAVRLISLAIETTPNEARYYNDRGVAFKRAGKLDEALADYTKALEIKPDYVNALNNRAVVYLEKGAYDRAVKDCTEAIKHREMLSKLYTNRGLAYAGMGDHAKAVEDYRQGVSHRPVDSRAFVFLAESLWKSGEKEQALQMYQLAQGLAKDSPISDALEKQITRLEKMFLQSNQRSTRPASSPVRAAAPDGRLPREKGEPLEQKPSEGRVSAVHTVGQLDRLCREKQIKRFSPEAAEVYRQGRQFQEKGDPHKALVRYEDTLQLAKKNRNALGVAWTNLEIGRVHLGLGDHVRALPHLGEASRAFVRLKSTDEFILVSIELAAAKRAGGMTRDADEFSAMAKNAALSAGYVQLAGVVDKPVPGTPPPRPRTNGVASRQDAAASKKETPATVGERQEVQPPAVTYKRATDRPESGPKTEPQRTAAEPATKLDRVPVTGAYRHMDFVGRGPAAQEAMGKRVGHPGIRENLTRTPLASLPRAPEPEKKHQAEREVFWVKGHPRPEKGIEDDSVLLRKLKTETDDATMIVLLERLADSYERQKKDQRALHALTASLGLREKLGRTGGAQELFFRAGMLREKLGQKTTALEEYTRGAVLSRAQGKTELAKAMDAKAKRLAKQAGLDQDAVVTSLEAIWEARLAGDEGAETRALHKIATVYERAGRLLEAENYYARLEASTLAQRAALMEKTGRSEQALRSRDKAAEAFKKLDYSRYVQMIKKSREADTRRDRKQSPPQAGL